MKYLLLLIPMLAFGQGTDLPGPIGALPDGAGVPTKICSYDAALAHCSGIVSDASTTGNWVITAKNTGYAFDNFVNPAGNLSESLGTCASSATCPGGTGAREWAIIHTQEVANYGPNPASYYSDTQLMVFDVGVAGQAIQFYTNNIVRLGIDDNGVVDFNLATGGADQCVKANSIGRLGISGGPCGAASLPGTGYREVCADASGALLAPLGGISGSYSTCPYGQTATTTCSALTPLTISPTSVSGCSITALSTGIWLVTASLSMSTDSAAAQANYLPLVNGGAVSGAPIATLINLASGTIGSTVSQSWWIPMNSGDVVSVSAYKTFNVGTANLQGGNLIAVRIR